MLLKYPGGKHYLAPKIVPLMPRSTVYCEPFLGAAHVFLAKFPSRINHLNDLNSDLMCFWNVVKTEPLDLIHWLKGTPPNRNLFERLQNTNYISNNIAIAAKEFTLRRLSLGGLKQQYSFSLRPRGGIPETLNAWHNAIDKIPLVSKLLHYTELTSENAYIYIQKIAQYYKDVFFYIDPPYLQSTRVAKEMYGSFEMKDFEHEILLDAILSIKDQKFMISGYDSELYNSKLVGWKKLSFTMTSAAGMTPEKVTKKEIIWRNY